MTRKHALALVAVLVLAPLGVALGAALTYSGLEADPAAYRTSLSSDDSLDFDTPLDAQAVNGSPTVVVLPQFSTAGATATIEVALYQSATGNPMGVAWVGTATASTSRVLGSAYIPDSPILVDTMGAEFYDVRQRDVSAGTLDLSAWTVGKRSSPAE